MAETFESKTEYDWNRFIRKHIAVFAVFVAAAIIAMWSMNSLVMFILHAIFWEIMLVGIPVAVAAIAGWLWWRRLPDYEKPESNKSSRSRDAGGAVSLLLFIAFAIKVYVDGYWNVAIASFTLDYVVGSMVTILIWIAAIFAIPAIIGLTWWLISGRNKKP